MSDYSKRTGLDGEIIIEREDGVRLVFSTAELLAAWEREFLVCILSSNVKACFTTHPPQSLDNHVRKHGRRHGKRQP